jgi:hypothetical protein
MSKNSDAEKVAFGTPLKSENPTEIGLFTPELLRARAEERIRRGDYEGAEIDKDRYKSEMMKTVANDIFGQEDNTGEEHDEEVMDIINYGPQKKEADAKMEMETDDFGNDLGFDYEEDPKLIANREEKGGRLRKKRRSRNTKRNTKRKVKRTRRKGRKVTKRRHNRRK